MSMNNVLLGQANQAKGQIYEESAIRLFIKCFNKNSFITRHLILDYSILENNNLSIYDAKNYKYPRGAYKKAKSSLKKIIFETENIDEYQLKVIIPTPINDPHIIYNENKKDYYFSNKKMGVNKNDVHELMMLINFLFNNGIFLERIRKYINNVELFKTDLSNLNKGTKNELFNFFVNINDVKEIIFSNKENIKNYFKSKIGKMTINELRRKKIIMYFDSVERIKKWK